MITVPDRVLAMVREVQEYLESQEHDDIRIEITAKAVYVQRRDEIRSRGQRGSSRWA